MILKPNLNIGFYFIRNGSWTLTCNVLSHVKLNLKLNLFQNLGLDYSISPVGNHCHDFSISLFFKIPKSKILTKKKILSRGGVLRETTLLNVQYGRFEVLSNPKTLYGQWRFLGQGEDNLPQHYKTKPTDEFQIVSTNKGSHARRNLALHQLVPLGSTRDLIQSPKCSGSILEGCLIYVFLIGALGFGFWVRTKDSFSHCIAKRCRTR